MVKGPSRSKFKDCGKGVQCYKRKEWRRKKRDYPTWDKKDSQGLGSSMTVAESTKEPGDNHYLQGGHLSSG